jgi:hypothetical protein
MTSRSASASALVVALMVSTMFAAGALAATTTEYSQHFGFLRKLSVVVAEAMPPEQYTSASTPAL